MNERTPILNDKENDSSKGLDSEENNPVVEPEADTTDGAGDGDDGTPTGGGSPGDRGDGYSRISLVKEVEQSYLGYAMSVIIGRALPNVRDGLKPVQRRCLFAMHELRNYYNRPTIKSARVSGDVSGKFHPHGDQAIYETLVRLAQDFAMRYPLIEGQGNFGSVDGDQPAAPRYTEMRMQRISSMMLADIDEETVDLERNYDDTLDVPTVLPTRVPNLLINGSDGIAVALATKMPPHNLGEVVDACIATIENPDITVEGLMEHIQGPDFPTGAIVNGRAGIVQAYRTGRGSILIRSQAEIVENDNQDMIVVTEIPYQVNKANLIKRIAELVKAKRIEGITELRDESDKDGLRIAIELRRGEIGQTVLNLLYRYTDMEITYAFNCNALVDNVPRRVTLKDQIEYFLKHRREVIARRTQYRLRQSRARGHIIEGQAVALANIDEVLNLIRAANNRQEAEESLLSRAWNGNDIKALLSEAERDIVRPLDLEQEYGFLETTDDGIEGQYALSPGQARAIVEMQLHRLTSLETEQLAQDYKDIVERLRDLLDIQDSDERVNQVMIEELTEIRDLFADPRRTEIRDAIEDLTAKALIKPQNVVITVSHLGYAKSIAADEYTVQNRGGKGVIGVKTKEDDFTQHVLVTHNHNTLLVFTNLGRVFWLDAYKIRMAGRTSRGYPLVNLLKLEEGESATYFFPLPEDTSDGYLLFATQNGIVKRTALSQFSRPRSVGLKAIKLDDGDRLIGVAHTDGHQDVMLIQSGARLVRFKESDIRAMSRVARGVKGMRLRGEDQVIGLVVPEEDGLLCTIDELGTGKRISLDQFRVQGRGSLGRVVKKRDAKLLSALQVFPGDHLMLLNESGKFIRIDADRISHLGVYANGVKLMNASTDDRVLEVVRVPAMGVEDDDAEDSPDEEA